MTGIKKTQEETCTDAHKHTKIEAKSTHTHISIIQGTLSFGSLSKRVDFDLSGVNFQEQIIEPLNLICCLRDPHRTIIT